MNSLVTAISILIASAVIPVPGLAQSPQFQPRRQLQQQPKQPFSPANPQSAIPDPQSQQPMQPGELPHPEVPSPVVIVEPTPLWMILLSAAVLITLVSLLGYFLLRKTVQVIVGSTRRPLKDALRSMKEVQTHADIILPAEIGQRVSAILRRYFMDRYGLPAPFRTSQELFPAAELVAAPRRTRHVQERFGPLASIYDTLAFGPSGGSREAAAALVETALTKLEEERLNEDPAAL